MSSSVTKKKRSAPAQHPIASVQSNILTNLLDCYDFLATHEYSDKTIGIQSFLTRKSVGDINFSDIVDDGDKRNRPGHPNNYVGILHDKRDNLPEIDASIEKCLMLNRLINYIEENEAKFAQLVSDIRVDIRRAMTDEPMLPNSYDFATRVREFNDRKYAQEIRRLFYQSHAEVKYPKSLVYLQNRTTEHLKSLMVRATSTSKLRQSQPLHTEFEAIFRSSFMIVSQPHSGVNPVTIYERKGPGEYTAKISVVIICLLNDFMQLYPDVIELYDIEPSLCPSSDYYKLEEPRSLSWKTCQLQTGATGKYHTFLYAELTHITIEQLSKSDTRVRFAQLIHSFKFAIKLQLNINDSKTPPTFEFPLESLVFGIGAHNNQIPQLLTRIIIEDIKRFSGVKPVNVETIQFFMQRYFIHRTGVLPNLCVNTYLEQELLRAKSQRSSFQSLEDIYLDFLVNFVYQVEFMAKHPILAMFHADGMFLGICNSERAAEAIVQSSVSGSPVVALRFNTIRIDYNNIASSAAAGRSVKLAACAVRVDIYNDRTKKLQNRTFDSGALASDISRFVTTSEKENANGIRVLSSFDDRANGRSYILFNKFTKYYDKRLQKLVKYDEKYKPVTDLVENANDGNTDDDISELNGQYSQCNSTFSPNSYATWSPTPSIMFDADNSRDTYSIRDYNSVAGCESPSHTIASSSQTILSASNRPALQQDTYVNTTTEAIIAQLMSRPEIAEQVVRKLAGENFPLTMNAVHQTPLHTQTPYQTQQPMPTQFPPQANYQQPTFPVTNPSYQYFSMQPPTQFPQTIPPQQHLHPQQQHLHPQQQQQQQHLHPQQQQQQQQQHQYPMQGQYPHPIQTQFPLSPVQQQQLIQVPYSESIHTQFSLEPILQQQERPPTSNIHHHPTVELPLSNQVPLLPSDDLSGIMDQFLDQINLDDLSSITRNELNPNSPLVHELETNENEELKNNPHVLRIVDDLKNWKSDHPTG